MHLKPKSFSGLINNLRRMVRITPFKGHVAEQSKVDKIIAPAYDVINSEEARNIAQGNEFSFLHVNKPEIDLPPETDLYSEQVYQKGKDNLQDFISKGFLVQEAEDIVYVYALTMEGRTQFGIVAGASVDDYENDHIKKHELTRKKKEEDRTKLTDIQGANAGPVFLTYTAQEAIDAIVASVCQRPSYGDVTCDDGVRHQLWKCTPEESQALVGHFERVSHTYIADGHHRAASAFNVGKIRKERALKEGKQVSGNEDFNYFLSILFPHNQLKIYDYNRVLKDLNGKTPEELLEALKDSFEVAPTDNPRPPQKHSFTLFLNNQWYLLKLKPERITGSDPVSLLDSQLLTLNCLAPIFGIEDLTTSERIDFVGGIRGLQELERRCSEDCVAAFALYPVAVEEVMAIADARQIMPPKTTWFEPKPRSGMVVRVFNN